MRSARRSGWARLLCLTLAVCGAARGAARANSGAAFLKLGAGARASGLGSAYTALADDVTSLHWNPAGLCRLHGRELSAMHAELFSDSRYDFLGYGQSAAFGAFGISAAYLSQGQIEGRSASRARTSEFTANDLAITLGAARWMSPTLSAGAGVKVLQSQIGGASATGAALDLGAVWQPLHSPFQAGAAVRNLGPQMKFIERGYELPLTFAGGVSYRVLRGLLLAGDLKHEPHDRDTSVSFGSEWNAGVLSLRAGYLLSPNQTRASGSSSQSLSGLQGLSMGIGLKFRSAILDYSLNPSGDLGNTHRISFTLKL